MHIPIVLIFALLTFFMAHAAWGMYTKYSMSRLNLKNKEQLLRETQRLKTQLDNKLRFIESDFGKEYLLRVNYSYAKDGEKMIVITKSDANLGSLNTNSADKKQNWFNKLFNWW